MFLPCKVDDGSFGSSFHNVEFCDHASFLINKDALALMHFSLIVIGNHGDLCLPRFLYPFGVLSCIDGKEWEYGEEKDQIRFFHFNSCLAFSIAALVT